MADDPDLKRVTIAATVVRARLRGGRAAGAFQARVLGALTDADAHLGEAAFAVAWDAGARLSPAAASAHLLEEYATVGVGAPDVQVE